MMKRKVLVTGGSGFIGTNLIEYLQTKSDDLLNIDVSPPLCSSQRHFWKKVDILDRTALINAFTEYKPTCVVHLAARTDVVEGTTVEQDYQANTEGTENVISAIKATPGIARVVITSTQYVHQPGHIPTDDNDCEPHTVYGQSKVVAERLTRQANLHCTWTIVRPTNIWGPWHMRHRSELLRVLRKGFYLYPGKKTVTKSYGYVKNIVYYFQRILEMPEEAVNAKTFYIGDEPADQFQWVNGMSRQLRGRDVHVVPRFVMHFMASLGDLITLVRGRKFILTTSRYSNMITDYLTPMQKTFGVLGKGPHTLEQGVRDTAAWLEMLDAE
ncbi:MAG: NAD-dependent epimerase/dehydratase family protein [Planctomycetota bacterium]|jgi:nucleoside-diphosphate-sugar epimerase